MTISSYYHKEVYWGKSHENECSSPGKCLWVRYHTDLASMESTKTYINITIGHTNIGTCRQTRLTSQNDSLDIADGIKLVKARLYTLGWRLHHDSSAELFDQEVKVVIENCRVVSDIKSLVSKIQEKGVVLVGFEKSQKFITAARTITGTIKT